MTMKMKGVLKGLRYITQIFDNESEDEPEMEIGLPTDVKHVAHIGWEGPSTAPSPSWMNDYKSSDDSTQQSTTGTENATSSTNEVANKTKPSKRRTSKNAADGTTQVSQSQDPSSIPKQSRKKKSSKGEGSSSGSSIRSRGKADSSSSSSKNGELGPATGNGGSTKSRRKKESIALLCDGPGSNNDELDTVSTLKTLKLEGNARDRISGPNIKVNEN